MATTKRTQMYFPVSLFEELQRIAQREHVSVAEVVRRAIREFMDQYHKRLDWKNDSLWGIIGAEKSDLKDLSIHHDHYLYGFPKKREKG